jgi:ABC-type sugar transport system permease subunit
MAENIAQRSSTYTIIGWISFILAIIMTPLFAVLGIIMGIVANSQSRGRGNAVIWANSIVLALGLIATIFFYGVAGLTIFGIMRAVLGM